MDQDVRRSRCCKLTGCIFEFNANFQQLLRNYTQNIDTLESLAGVERVLQCHGSFKTASCLVSSSSVETVTLCLLIIASAVNNKCQVGL